MADPALIVGAGPTGLTAALELTRFGIAVRLIDRLPQRATTSRALGVQARTLELMAQRGLADAMIEAGHRVDGVSVFGGGKRLFRLDLGRVDSRYNLILILSQAETERILTEALQRQGVAIERGVEMIALAQDALSRDPAPVMAMLRHADGRIEQARAPWLISAEGAHSLTRTTLDLRFQGKTLDEHFGLADLRIEGDVTPSDLVVFSSAHGFLGLFPMGGDRFRVIASNPVGDIGSDPPPRLEQMQATYDQRAHIPARLHDMGWSSWFRINSRMVSMLKVGRMLLGGDAAHIHSPAGGQGMNTGIQDMINLGWKLALVMRGAAPEALLDTYADDRLPVMRDVLFRTETMTRLMGGESAVIRGVLNNIAPYVAGATLVQEAGSARVSQVAVSYRGSRFAANRPHAGSLRAGDRVPDLPVRHWQNGHWEMAGLQTVLDPLRFVLLAAHEAPVTSCRAGISEAAAWGDLLRIVHLAPPEDPASVGLYQSALGHGGSLFLVRPDAYVALAVGEHSAAAALARWHEQWLGKDAPCAAITPSAAAQ